MTTKSEIVEHYASHNLIEKIENALKETYGDITKLDWDQISAFDQFHIRGLSATKELADRLKLTSEAHVLDIGCGLGGPARYLASTYGCNVTGIDLTPEYVETANWLTNLTDLSDKVNCQIADATTLPFDNLRFDFVWTQHVAMNIAY
jgi:2-polyprenyl-3-methyl-5-hydroxy-6-metoxy-1,4-benzoquinol methylase